MKTLHMTAVVLALLGTFALLSARDADPASAGDPERSVLEVRATGPSSFELSANEIPSGWTTVRLTNGSSVVHFAIVEKMPEVDGEQKTVEDSEEEVVPVFQNIMDDIRGLDPRFPEAGFELPAWYEEVVFLGGPGLVSPGETGEVTLDLEPGTYVIECYVKMPDGTFHSTEGMVEGLTVTESPSGGEPPAADARVTVSFDGGIEMNGGLEAGRRTVEVVFTDQRAHEHFLGHDVHLVRLHEGPEGTDLDELGAWMSWSAPDGLAEPAPTGMTFVGGTHEMPAGSTTYVTAELEAGDYAWIAEIPDPAGKNMLVEFSVP
ncbi:MAG: hypothetical protein ACODAA_06960 [Gemmatimonadota bacterium]